MKNTVAGFAAGLIVGLVIFFLVGGSPISTWLLVLLGAGVGFLAAWAWFGRDKIEAAVEKVEKEIKK